MKVFLCTCLGLFGLSCTSNRIQNKTKKNVFWIRVRMRECERMHTQHIRRDYRFIWYRFIDQRLRSFNVSFDNNLRLVIVRDANTIPLSMAYSSIFTQTHTHCVQIFKWISAISIDIVFPFGIFFVVFCFVLLRLYYLFIFSVCCRRRNIQEILHFD